MISPDTYSCNLCKLTHRPHTIRKNWAEFIKKSGYNFIFLYKDQFLKEFQDFKNVNTNFPAIYLWNSSDRPYLILSGSEIKSVGSDRELIAKLNAKLIQA